MSGRCHAITYLWRFTSTAGTLILPKLALLKWWRGWGHSQTAAHPLRLGSSSQNRPHEWCPRELYLYLVWVCISFIQHKNIQGFRIAAITTVTTRRNSNCEGGWPGTKLSLISFLISWILLLILALHIVRIKYLTMQVNLQSSGVFYHAVFWQSVVVSIDIIKWCPNPHVALEEIP